MHRFCLSLPETGCHSALFAICAAQRWHVPSQHLPNFSEPLLHVHQTPQPVGAGKGAQGLPGPRQYVGSTHSSVKQLPVHTVVSTTKEAVSKKRPQCQIESSQNNPNSAVFRLHKGALSNSASTCHSSLIGKAAGHKHSHTRGPQQHSAVQCNLWLGHMYPTRDRVLCVGRMPCPPNPCTQAGGGDGV